MTDQSRPSGMFGLWEDWAKTNEEMWTRMLNNWVRTDTFSASLGRVFDNYLLGQNVFSRVMQEYMTQVLRTMNIASGADVNRIAELVINLENKVDMLADEIDTLHQELGALRQQRAASAERGQPPTGEVQ
jgi:polyhydroxyalkanoic acid synthase PhaR subunit